MKRIGYARVSTEGQELHVQINALKHAKCERIFREKISGKSVRRPALSRALARLGQGDRLVVWKADRLGRDFNQLIDLARQLEENGVVLECLSEGIRTENSAGRLCFRVAAAFSAFEHEQICGRTSDALQDRKRRGQKLGRRRAINARQLAQAVALRDKLPVSRIAKRLRVNRVTLKRALDEVA